MRKTYTIIRTAGLLALLCLWPGAAQAQVAFYDSFDYDLGDLYQQGPWVRYGTVATNPVQVIEKELTYEGFPCKLSGKAAKFGPDKSSEKLIAAATTEENAKLSGDIYCALLIDVENAGSKGTYIAGFVPRTKNQALADGILPTEYGRLYVKPGSTDGKFQIGIERGGTNTVYSETEYDLGTTYVVVFKYQGIKETDDIKLYVNPASYTEEPATADASIDGVNWTGSKVGSYGLQGIELRQSGTSSATGPTYYVGAVSVADSYAALFPADGGEVTPPADTPAITLSSSSFSIDGNGFQGLPVKGVVKVTAKALAQDIAVSVEGSDEVTPAVTAIPASEAMSAAGYLFEFTLSGQSVSGEASIRFSSEGATDQTLPVSWQLVPTTVVGTVRELADATDEEAIYCFTGSAVVTYVSSSISGQQLYVQDETAGLLVSDEFGALPAFSRGDKITGLVGGVMRSLGASQLVPYSVPAVVGQGVEAEPFAVTLSALKAEPARYVNSLVRISGVSVKDVAEGALFAEGMANPTFTDGTDEGTLRVLAGTTLIGTGIPAGDFTLTGLSTSAGAVVVAPRGVEDIALPPSLDVDEVKFERAEGRVGETAVMGVIRLKATNLSAPVTLEVTGTNRAMFGLSADEEFMQDGAVSIPAGTHEAEVTVNYVPTEIGTHKGNLQIDCAAMPDAFRSFALAGIAIDPANPPALTAAPEAVAPFSAVAGETQETAIDVTSANAADYVNLKLEKSGTFRISSSLVWKNVTSTIKITFAPTAAGEFDDVLLISTYGTDTLRIPLRGTATERATVPEREGDALPLVTENPRTLLIEGFDGVEHNRPLSLEGWKNLAVTGDRAWWGYTFPEEDALPGEKAAKVTPYDSKVEDGDETDCEMTLVTPPLDFVNSASKMFTFRVRGDYLLDGQSDVLELCYIEKDGDGMYLTPVGGFTMPAATDLSGEWQEFHVDLAGQDLADVFFMGFRFKSQRGTTHAATYYIDDVTYGRTDIPVITPGETEVPLQAVAGADAMSAEIAVTTANLQEPVTLSLYGGDKSKFSLSASSLPAEGGSFTVSFRADETGPYETYVKLSSRGAADKYVHVAVTNTTGIESLRATPADIQVYDVAGRLVRRLERATPRQAASGLPAGIYLFKTTDGVRKVRID